MSLLAAIRPDEWSLPLFVHILGAFATVGALILATTYLVPAWRTGSLASVRLGFRTLLWAALPAFIVMRVGAEWLYSEEGIGDLPDEPAWIGVGYGTSDLGALLLIASLIVTGVSIRRAGAAEGEAAGGRASAILVGSTLVLYVVAIWAMTTKPA